MWVAGQKLAQHAPRHCLFYFPLSAAAGHRSLFLSFFFVAGKTLIVSTTFFHNCFVRVSRWWSVWWSKFIRVIMARREKRDIYWWHGEIYRRMKSRVALVLDIYDVMMTRNTTLSLSLYTLMSDVLRLLYRLREEKSLAVKSDGTILYIWRGRRDDDDDVNAANNQTLPRRRLIVVSKEEEKAKRTKRKWDSQEYNRGRQI